MFYSSRTDDQEIPQLRLLGAGRQGRRVLDGFYDQIECGTNVSGIFNPGVENGLKADTVFRHFSTVSPELWQSSC